jgi:Mg/Co/Ni transporter MgtE
MDHQFIALSANDEQTETITIFKNNGRFALPVINESGVLLGIVTSDDVLRLAERKTPVTSKNSAAWRRSTSLTRPFRFFGW